MSGIASLGGAALFSRIDINADRKVSAAEFISARPVNVSEDQAKSLFEKIDTEKSGSVNQQQLDDGLKASRPAPFGGNLSKETLAVLLEEVQKQGGGAKGPPPAGGRGGGGESASSEDEIDPADANRDGTVSAQEKLAYELKQAEEKQKEAARQEARQAAQRSPGEFATAVQSYANVATLLQGAVQSPA